MVCRQKGSWPPAMTNQTLATKCKLSIAFTTYCLFSLSLTILRSRPANSTSGILGLKTKQCVLGYKAKISWLGQSNLNFTLTILDYFICLAHILFERTHFIITMLSHRMLMVYNVINCLPFWTGKNANCQKIIRVGG